MKNLLPFVFILYANFLFAQQNESCSQDSLYQVMDFWVGEWKVYDSQDTLIGFNKIDKILNACAIMEHWEGATGGKGKSLFYVDNTTRNWKQVWITQDAKKPWGQKEKKLLFYEKDSLLLFQGEYFYKKYRVLDRTILKKEIDQKVIQTIQVSYDGGQNWETTFTGIYKKQ